MGKPIVAFDLPETKFTAKDSAIYVPHGDIFAFAHEIIKLLDDPKLCVKMGKIGRERIKNEMSWDHQAQKLIKVYNLAARISNKNQ